MGIQGLYANNGFNLRAHSYKRAFNNLRSLEDARVEKSRKELQEVLCKMGNNISGRTDAWVNLFSLEILLSVPFPRKCKYAEAFLGNMGAVGHRPRFSLVPEKWEHR